jgi:dimethylhistidine N-methyltransferase
MLPAVPSPQARAAPYPRENAPPRPDDSFAAAVLDGLSRPAKSLPPRFFYDAAGSALFEDITRLAEYYPTRTEKHILATHAADMVDGLAANGVLVEFGSGSSLKTELLLAHAPRNVAYVAVDVSATALADAKARLKTLFPNLDVCTLLGDFSDPIRLPSDLAVRPKLGFFPGSTIGNFRPSDAVNLLRSFAVGLSAGGRLIVGVDTKKDPATLIAAYDDASGVTAAFNRNILARINRELGADIDLGTFRHEATYNAREGRIEMHLISTIAQEIRIGDKLFRFRAGENIHTENSYKYSVWQFQDLARVAGWLPARVWTDEDQQFSVHELVASSA